MDSSSAAARPAMSTAGMARRYIGPLAGMLQVYTHADFNATTGKQHPNYRTAGLMADYSLSKRTDV